MAHVAGPAEHPGYAGGPGHSIELDTRLSFQDPQSTQAMPEDPAKDINFRESEIDQLRSHKDQVSD